MLYWKELNAPEPAHELIRSTLEQRGKEISEEIIALATQEYLRGDDDSAYFLYTQLWEHFPDNKIICNNYGYILIGERNYATAEPLLLKVYKERPKDEYSNIAACNLAYIYALKQKPKKALVFAETALGSKLADEKVILRIPFFLEGEIIADPAQYPGRSISIKTAALGCAVTASLAIGEIDKASAYLAQIKEESADETTTSLLSGSLELAKGNEEKAYEHWQEASALSENEDEPGIILRWLEDLA